MPKCSKLLPTVQWYIGKSARSGKDAQNTKKYNSLDNYQVCWAFYIAVMPDSYGNPVPGLGPRQDKSVDFSIR